MTTSSSARWFLPLLSLVVVTGACRIDVPAAPAQPATLVAVQPGTGEAGAEQRVTLVGQGFAPRVTQDLGAADGVRVDATFTARLGDVALGDVKYQDGEHLSAVIPATLPEGTHALVVTTPFGEEVTLADAYVAAPPVVVAPAALSGTLTLPPTVVASRPFELTLLVENTGEAVAEGVLPSAPSVTTTGNTRAALRSEPDAADVPPGEPVAFVWQFDLADGDGTIAFTTEAVGVDASTGEEVSTGPVSSPVADVVTSAFVTLSTPAVVSVGQTFDVTMTVRNHGETDLADVQPLPLWQVPEELATLVTAPAAPFPTLAAGGGEASFTFTYRADSAGTLAFDGNAVGTDVDTQGTVTTPMARSNDIVIEAPPAFAGTWSAPAAVTYGQAFDVELTVENTGDAAATGVAPAALVVTGATGTTCEGSSTPATDLDGAAEATFSFSCTAGDTSGPFALSTTVSGTDENAAVVVTSEIAPSDDGSVQSPPALALAWTLPATDVSHGQPFALVLDVVNAGEASATATAGDVTVLGATGTTCAAASPATTTVPGAGTASFTYECTAGGASGDVSFAAGVTASDANSGEDASAPALETAPLVVESPAALSAAWAPLPARVAFAGGFTAELTVTNAGEAPAAAVTPSSVLVSGSGTTCAGPTPASATIEPSAQQVFSFSCTAAAPSESALLSVAVNGSDGNSGAALTAAAVDELLVGSVAVLDIVSVTAADATVYQGQRGVRVELAVANLGEADVDIASDPSWLVFTAQGVDVSAEHTVTPLATNVTVIAGGATEALAFDVDLDPAATLGEVLLDAAVFGSDALDGTPTSDAGATTPDTWTVAVNEPPVACFVTDVNAREVGQAFAVDASCSSDVESPGQLTVEWDWQGDGTFDTAPSATLTASYAFASEGTYDVTARVTDAVGFTSYASHTVVVAASGRLHLVTNANATGAGSFVDALAAANGAPGPDTIAFHPQVFTGLDVITLNNAQAPVITDAGTSVVGHAGVRISSTRGITVASADNLIAYLELSGATQNNASCVLVSGTGNRVVGTAVTGCDAFGVDVTGSGNTVGPGNVLAGGYGDGAAVRVGASQSVVVANTFRSCTGACVDVLAGTSDSRVLRNVLRDVNGDGIVLAGTNHDVHHNTLHTIFGAGVDVTGSGHSVRNNVFSAVFTGAVCDASAGLDVDYNDLFDVLPNACEATHGPATLTVDPRFVDAAGGDLRLARDSPLIDAGDPALGLDVNATAPGLYDGAAPDLGAFEHNPG